MKLIIDIPEMAYEAFKEWHKNKVATVEQSIIANGTPYEERLHGEWISRRYINGADWAKSFDMKVCNCCDYEFSYDAETGISDANFCPNCGAKMKEGGEK